MSPGTDDVQHLRPLMFSIAYRMLGSVGDAEDIVQEAFVRYYRALVGRDEHPVHQGLSVRGHHQAEHRPAAVRPGAAGNLCRPMASGAAADRPDRDRSRGHRATGGHGVHGVPAGAGKAQSGRAGGVPAARRLRLRIRRDRRDRGQVAGQLPASWRSGHDAGSSTTGHGSRRPAGGARSWPIASWPRCWTVISTLWSPRWPPMWWWSATAAERARRGRGRSWVRTRSPGCCSHWPSRSAGSASRCSGRRSTASREPCSATRPGN